LAFDVVEENLKDIPHTQTRLMMNIGSPAAAFHWWRLPCDGVGLARMEFIINNTIKIHPMALVRFDRLEDRETRRQINKMIHHLIQAAHQAGRTVGICGEAPSNYQDFAGFLVDAGIDSISLNPDGLVRVKQHVAWVEQKARQDRPHGS
jgi:phosphoenolpyruvate synthase/pyruvate phosphate dikinase